MLLCTAIVELVFHITHLAFAFHHVAMRTKGASGNNDKVVYLEFWGDSTFSAAAVDTTDHCARGGNIFRRRIQVLFLQVTNRLAARPRLQSSF